MVSHDCLIVNHLQLGAGGRPEAGEVRDACCQRESNYGHTTWT